MLYHNFKGIPQYSAAYVLTTIHWDSSPSELLIAIRMYLRLSFSVFLLTMVEWSKHLPINHVSLCIHPLQHDSAASKKEMESISPIP